ncbi:MAG: transposon-encoded TnpW family protein [Firmicutes bacterium]|nr:transposon-encoded TnpW family protein [Bacillota bacterium]
MSDNFIKIAEPYKRQIGNVTYIVSAFGNAKAKHNADEMIMRMLENKILNGEEVLSNGNGKGTFAGEAQA